MKLLRTAAEPTLLVVTDSGVRVITLDVLVAEIEASEQRAKPTLPEIARSGPAVFIQSNDSC